MQENETVATVEVVATPVVEVVNEVVPVVENVAPVVAEVAPEVQVVVTNPETSAPVVKPKKAKKVKAVVKPAKAKTVKAKPESKENRKKESKMKATKQVAKSTKQVAKDGRGRPAIYTGFLETQIVKGIKEFGLTGARKEFAKRGLKQERGADPKKLKISLPTLGKIAKRNGVELTAGRPPMKVAA